MLALLDLVGRFPGRRILVVGDFMLDRYVFGDAERISPEAPVPVLRVIERQDRVGGAGSVAVNVAALGASVACFGVVGNDTFADRLARFLADAGADVSGLLRVADRPTTTKTRLVGLAEHRHRQQILRVDDEVVAPLSEADETRLIESVRAAMPACDAVCLEDYAKGVLSPRVCREIIESARAAGKPVLIDPARTDWRKYRSATLLTPNRAEFEFGVGRRLAEAELDAAGAELAASLDVRAIVVTLGRDGARVIHETAAGYGSEHFPTKPRAVYDNTGAGDAVLAMLAVAIAAGAELAHAVPLANIAGGLEVQKFGCVPITRDEVVHELHGAGDSVQRKLRSLEQLQPELAARRSRGESVVFTNGCFDLLHPGHVELLEKSRAKGSLLVVGLNSDASIRLQGKGDDRPIRDQRSRVRMLAALEAVDYVVLFDNASVESLVAEVAPDVLVKGSEVLTDGRGVTGAEGVTRRGGRVETVRFLDGFSTTAELQRIRGTR
jgi:D-beta-D-heptose 7-phosphate kinase / D-beta-D-heptose 1-phosphate adenosyltransferase